MGVVPLFLLLLCELFALLPAIAGGVTTLRVDALVIAEVVAYEASEIFFFASLTGCPVKLTVDPLSAALAALFAVHDKS